MSQLLKSSFGVCLGALLAIIFLWRGGDSGRIPQPDREYNLLSVVDLESSASRSSNANLPPRSASSRPPAIPDRLDELEMLHLESGSLTAPDSVANLKSESVLPETPVQLPSQDHSVHDAIGLPSLDELTMNLSGGNASVASSESFSSQKSLPGDDQPVSPLEKIESAATPFRGVQTNPFFQADRKAPSVNELPSSRTPSSSNPVNNIRSSGTPSSNNDIPEIDLWDQSKRNLPHTDQRRVASSVATESSVLSQDQPLSEMFMLKQSSLAPAPSVTLTESVALRAVKHIEYGKTLARRGAKASARQEFIAALSVIAQDFDSQTRRNDYSLALRRGIQALKESDEFAWGESEMQIGMDVSGIVEAHQSGALTRHEAAGVTPIQALQRYFGFAQSQFEYACGRNVVAAEAFYVLGRLHTLTDTDNMIDGKLDKSKAMVYHRTSLACDPRNYRSANELGVLLAEFGELNEARELFLASLRIEQNPKTWENLAKVHQRLNQPQMAELAWSEHQRALANLNSGMIRWIESPDFNAMEPMGALNGFGPPHQASQPDREANSANLNKDETPKKSLTERVRSWF